MKDNITTIYLEQEDSLLDSVEFIRIVYIIKKSIWWILLFFGLSFAVAFLSLRYTKPLYQSSSTLKLEIIKTSGAFGFANNSIDENNIFGEMEFIKSDIILNEVVNSLPSLNVGYYKQGKFLTDERFGNAPIKLSFLPSQVNHIIDQKINIRLVDKNTFELWLDSNESDVFSAKYDKQCRLNNALFSVQRTEYYTELEEGGEFYFVIHSRDMLMNYLAENLSVTPINLNANTIEISFSDHNKAKASAIVNTIDRVYLKKTIEQKQLEKQSSIEYINDQLTQTRAKLDQAEKEIELFLSQNGIVDVDSKQSRLINTAQELSNRKILLSRELQNLTKIAGSVESDSNITDEIYAYELKNDPLNQLLSDYDEELKQFKKIQNTNKPTTSAYQNSEKSINLLTTKLKLRLEKQIEGHEYEISQINQEVRSIEKELTNYPSLKSAFNKLQRSYELYEGFYLSLEEKKIEYGIAKAGIIPKFTILSPANSSGKPIYPIKLQVMGIAFAIAFTLSVLFLFIRYLMYNTIISLKELEKLTNIPIIGTVPEYKNSKHYSALVVNKFPKSALSESLRSIRTGLEYFESNTNAKVICFTSTISGEGKTFMSVNLAGVLAMTEQKVILLDLDLRRPKVHKAFQHENGLGMSDLLIGKATIEDCIRQSELESLDFITSGTIPPNPSELIMRPEFNQLIRELSETYKFIFIDSPPVGLVTDAHILMKKCDVPIYVIKAGYSSRGVVKKINRLHKENHYPQFTLALNAVQYQESYKSGYNNYGYYEENSNNGNNLFKKFWKLFTKKNLL